ncbi:hypothetical protein OH492_16660 [Vibrio chagasii]|nr:hypothetical protein [Vibrio chagasii]
MVVPYSGPDVVPPVRNQTPSKEDGCFQIKAIYILMSMAWREVVDLAKVLNLFYINGYHATNCRQLSLERQNWVRVTPSLRAKYRTRATGNVMSYEPRL